MNLKHYTFFNTTTKFYKLARFARQPVNERNEPRAHFLGWNNTGPWRAKDWKFSLETRLLYRNSENKRPG